MTTFDFDELNILDFSGYFGEMSLTAEQKQKRIGFAERLYDGMFLYFEKFDRKLPDDDLLEYLMAMYGDILEVYAEPDDYLNNLTSDFANDVHGATRRNSDKPYFTSAARAAEIAANEANNVLNYAEYRTALTGGYTKKTWYTMRDEKVRLSHMQADGKTIMISSLFQVGGSLMRFPRDTSLGADPGEIINCRCTIKYS